MPGFRASWEPDPQEVGQAAEMTSAEHEHLARLHRSPSGSRETRSQPALASEGGLAQETVFFFFF